MQPLLSPFSKRSLVKFLSLFGLCLLLAIGCNRAQTPPTTVDPASGDRVVIGTTLKPRTLDPADSYELAGSLIHYNVGDRLYTYGLGSTILEPQLAAAMPTVSADGLTYTIPLREGVIFHDGYPFNAEAMVFSLQRFMENGGKPSFLLADVVEEIEATGEFELTITLKQPFAAFTSLLAFSGTCAVSPQAYEIGAGQFNPNAFVGTGPYTLASFSSDSIRLDPFPEYWGAEPANDGIDIQVYAGNSANLFNAFRKGDIDVAYQSLAPNQVKSLKEGAQQGEWQAVEAPGTTVSYMVLNLQSEPLTDPAVRQAIAATIDRDLINERVLQGQGEPIYSLIPTAFEVYRPAFQEQYGSGSNVEKAKQLLQEAGFSAANPAAVEVWYPSGSSIRGIVASTLKAYADDAFEGMLQLEPKAVESAIAFSNLAKGTYQTFLVDWYPDFLDADNYVHPFLSCREGSAELGCEDGAARTRGSFYYSDRANELIDRQRQAQDPEARRQIFAEIQAILAEDVPYIPLWQSKDYAFARQGIEGVSINPSQEFPFRTISKS